MNYKGVAYYYLKEYYKAIDCIDQVLQLDPKHTDALNNKGLIYYNLKEYQKAIDCFDKV